MLALRSSVGAPRWVSRVICPLLGCLRIALGLCGSLGFEFRLLIEDCLRRFCGLLFVFRLLMDGWRRGDCGSGLETRLTGRDVLILGVVAPLLRGAEFVV